MLSHLTLRAGRRPLRPLASLLFVVACSILTAATPPVDLTAGAVWQYSLDEGKTFVAEAPTIPKSDKVPVVARTEFNVPVAGSFAALELLNDLIPSLPKIFTLNGHEVQPLLPVMHYNRYPAIDASWLKVGRNVLTARVVVDARRRDIRFQPQIRLLGIAPDATAIEVGPVLGAGGPDWFTVTCRTNLKVPVRVLRLSESGASTVVAESAPGIFHRFRVPHRRGDSRRMALVAGESTRRHEFTAAELPEAPGGHVRIAVTSDPQSAIKGWSVVSQAILAAKPDFLVFGGDLIASGRDDDAWAPELFAPAGELFAHIPTYTVHGNHEGQAPVVEEYFYGAGGPDGRGRNWVRDFGDVTLIGIDQWIHLDWEPGSENVRWFERALREADSKYVFVVMHYPAYSSCSHGKVDADAVPIEREIRRGRQVLVPLMQRYGVTALLAGHDHYYERTELPDGFLQIITGGGGDARDGQVKDARRQNPYSKFHASTNHYSLIEVKDGACTLTATKPDGTVIDRVTFRPRPKQQPGRKS